jgi:hypothetical protein
VGPCNEGASRLANALWIYSQTVAHGRRAGLVATPLSRISKWQTVAHGRRAGLVARPLSRISKWQTVAYKWQTVAYRSGAGLMATPLSRISKWRWGPVLSPVLPTNPTVSPLPTLAPTFVLNADWCA